MPTRAAWCQWEFVWDVREPGGYQIMARARSTAGHVQPTSHDSLRGGYMINFGRPQRVQVEADVKSEAHGGDLEALLYDMDLFAEQNVRLPLDLDMAFTDGAGI